MKFAKLAKTSCKILALDAQWKRTKEKNKTNIFIWSQKENFKQQTTFHLSLKRLAIIKHKGMHVFERHHQKNAGDS